MISRRALEEDKWHGWYLQRAGLGFNHISKKISIHRPVDAVLGLIVRDCVVIKRFVEIVRSDLYTLTSNARGVPW